MWRGRDVISILDFSRDELETLFRETTRMERLARGLNNIMRGRILALLFFEPSTRTMYSFQSAMYRLGGECLVLKDVETSSIAKGESIADTIRMMDGYSDAIVIRHRIEGMAKYASEIAEVPVINAGDGAHKHPTQAMIDLYTIWRERGSIDGLSIGVLGDLRYGRASTSFIYGVSIFNPEKIYLISPPELRVKDELRDFLDFRGIEYIETNDLRGVIGKLDVLYVTRIQKERFTDLSEYERVRGTYRVSLSLLTNVKDELMIMHPLPRVDEISVEVDSTKYAYYFKEARNGIPVRMALLKLILMGVD